MGAKYSVLWCSYSTKKLNFVSFYLSTVLLHAKNTHKLPSLSLKSGTGGGRDQDKRRIEGGGAIQRTTLSPGHSTKIRGVVRDPPYLGLWWEFEDG